MAIKRRDSTMGPQFLVAKMQQRFEGKEYIDAFIHEPESQTALTLAVTARGTPSSTHFKIKCKRATAEEFQGLVDLYLSFVIDGKLEWGERLTGPEVNSFIFSKVTPEQRRFFERRLDERVAECLRTGYAIEGNSD